MVRPTWKHLAPEIKGQGMEEKVAEHSEPEIMPEDATMMTRSRNLRGNFMKKKLFPQNLMICHHSDN